MKDFITATLTVWVLITLLFSYINFSFDPRDWQFDLRVIYGIVMVLSLVGCSIYSNRDR